MAASVDRDRVADLTKSMEETLRLRTRKSGEFVEEAKQVLPGGVASSFQEHAPHSIYIVEGDGSKVVDLDGNEYADFHNGFGVMVVGHANPAISAAIAEVATKGHALYRSQRELGSGCPRIVSAIPASQGPVLEFRNRGDARRGTTGEGVHRQGFASQDRGLLSRSP